MLFFVLKTSTQSIVLQQGRWVVHERGVAGFGPKIAWTKALDQPTHTKDVPVPRFQRNRGPRSGQEHGGEDLG